MPTKQLKSLPKSRPLPPLPGAVCVQWKRCGYSGCKCHHGALHGPYYYRFWREDGRLRKVYVRRSQVKRTRAACAAYRRQQQGERARRAIAEMSVRQLLKQLREIERWAD